MGYLTKATIDGSDYKLAGALFGTCDTAAATAAKVVTCADFDDFETGVTIAILFTYENTAGATLNVNSKGAKGAYSAGTGAPKWEANSVVTFTYDGTKWIQNDYQSITDTKNTAGSTNSANKLYLIGAKTQTANPQTYSNSKVYATDGDLVADSYNGVGLSSNGNEATLSAGTLSFTIAKAANSWAIHMGAGTSGQTPSLTIPANTHWTLGGACAKGVDTSIASGSTSTDLPTTAAVVDYVDDAVATATAGGLTYKGTATALTDITDTNYKKGWYWMVGTNPSITIDGQACEAGDMIIAKQDKTSTADNDLDVIQSNIVALTTAEIDADWAAA